MNKPKTGITTFVVAVAVVLACATGASAMTVTSTGDSGACTLRAAINAAAANDSGTPCGAVVSGGTTPINLPANTYTPFDGQLVVPAGANIAINGDNVNNPLTTVIDATNASPRRVFEVKSAASVTMSGLTITGGRTSAGAAAANPFQAFSGENGGGILNQGGLTLDHVVVTGNQAGDGGAGANGPLEGSGGGAGAGGSGGGIYNADNASLTVSNSVISDNVAGDGGNGGDGGMGVNASGHFPNGSAGGNGGPGGSGGGIYNSNFGSVTITNSTVSGNFSGRGGNGGAGGQGAGGNATFTSGGTGGDGGDGGNNGKQYRKDQGTFWDDTRGGGGIYSLGTLNMSGSTVKGNGTGAGGLGGPSGPGGQNNFGSNEFRTSGRAGSGGGGGRGGGLLNGSWHQGTMSLTNVTVTGNQTGDGGTGGGGAGGAANTLGGGRGGYGGDGGGIWAQGAHDHETLLTHVTIAKNFLGGAGAGGGSANNSTLGPGTRGAGAGVAVGGRFNPGGSGVYLKKTLISSNGFSGNPTFDKNCAQAQPVTSYTEFADLGHNLSYPDDGSPCPGLTNVDPDLGPVGSNGGQTETMVPQPGSAAIGGVPLGSCDITIDQRGFPRPGADGASCDIGAVETGTAPSTTPTTTGLVSSANPSAPGQQVTYTATVSPPPSSGTVEFKDGGTTIPGCATTPLTPGGQFTCSVTYPAAGSHSIVAAYSGNSLFVASSSSALNQTVQGTTPPPDTTAPDTMIDSGPTGRISQTEATFAFHGTPGDTAKLQCGLDSGAFADCTSPKTFTGLSAGAHNVRFRAVDASGNADASPATGSFTVDTGSLPPPRKASIGKLEVSGPRRVDRGDKATFSVAITNTGNAAASGVKLKVTGGGVNVGDSVGQVGADRTKTVKVKAKLNQAGRKRLTFKVTSANAGARAVSKTVTVRN